MSTDDQTRREIWLLALKDQLAMTSCPTCQDYLQKVSQYSYVMISNDLEIQGEMSGGYFHAYVGLHSGSRLFPDVFKPKTSVQEGHFQGFCSTCGRGYKYFYQPKSSEPGKLSVQRNQARSDFSNLISKAEPPAKAVSKPAEPKRRIPPKPANFGGISNRGIPGAFPPKRQPVRHPKIEVFRPSGRPSRVSGDPSVEHHQKLLLGPPEGGDWAKKLEHRWTTKWETEVSFWGVWPTPKVIWVETRRSKHEGFLPDVTAFDRHTGEILHRTYGAHLIAADAELVLIKPKSQILSEFALRSSSGERLWESSEEVALKGLTTKAVLAVDRFTNALVMSRSSNGGAKLGPWKQLYESDTFKLQYLLSRGSLWTATFEGSSQKTEVRCPGDSEVLYKLECGFGFEDKTFVTPDPWGWTVQNHGQIQSYRADGKLACEFRGPELLSPGPRFIVGKYKGDPGGIWGAAEASLGAFDRWTGKSRSMSQEHFRNRRCFCLSGDVLWCVCESEKVLRGYDLSSSKVVREITPLPIQATPRHLPGKIQNFAKYGRDLYLTSKAGYLLAFSSDDE